MSPVNTQLNPELRRELRARLWQDDLARMPRHLYPDRSEADLFEMWRHDYNLLFVENVSMTETSLQLFAPAAAADMKPRYLADPAGSWYALVTLRYNRRSNYRFCYVRYWWAANKPALRAMVQALLAGWPAVPFDWLKFRLGYGSTLTPSDFHPRAIWQTYVVAGRPSSRAFERQEPAAHPSNMTGLTNITNITIEEPAEVEERWWQPYLALLDEQERLAPGLMENWSDYQAVRLSLRQEMVRLLQSGGKIINLWQAGRLVGHISWLPHSYREQLIERCWHIYNVIVAASHRRQALGKTLHRLALARMNLVATPIVAGLVSAGNKPSLKTAAKVNRRVVDSYLIVPNIK